MKFTCPVWVIAPLIPAFRVSARVQDPRPILSQAVIKPLDCILTLASFLWCHLFFIFAPPRQAQFLASRGFRHTHIKRTMLEPSIRLRQAIVEGNLLVVKRLLKRFPDLLENSDPANGWSSLHYASYNGRYLVCVHLISLGHDKNEVLRTFKGNTSVHLALSRGHEQTTHLLLQHFPGQLDVSGEDGETPLHVSVKGDFYRCVEMLLSIGCDVDIVDKNGNNALHLAMKYGSVHCVEILVHHGVSHEIKNSNGLRPVDVAASFSVEKLLVDLLSDSQAQSSHSGSSGSISDPSPLKKTTTERKHSDSLPPLPTVTTTRRFSGASTQSVPSPQPRSALSTAFPGSTSSSYIYSPVKSNPPLGLSIKPLSTGLLLDSPVLFSPSSTTPGIIPSIRDDGNTVTVPQTLSSHTSMSSLSSQAQGVSFQRLRSASRGRGSPEEPSVLSRSSTHSDGGSGRKILNLPAMTRTRPGNP